MFGFGILDTVKIGAGVALGVLVAFGPVYLYGKAQGRSQAAVEALETSVKILRERNSIDEEISTADAAALCRDFGLPDSDAAECVRRVQEADADTGDERLHRSE